MCIYIYIYTYMCIYIYKRTREDMVTTLTLGSVLPNAATDSACGGHEIQMPNRNEPNYLVLV